MFEVGQEIIFQDADEIEAFLRDTETNTNDWFYSDRVFIVHSIQNNGELHTYQDLTWWGVNEEGDEYELDEPEGFGPSLLYQNHYDSKAYTLEMLKELRNSPQNTLDSICKKVVQLYRKHNNNVNAEFKFSGV